MRDWIVGILLVLGIVLLYQQAEEKRREFKIVPAGDVIQIVRGEHRFFFTRTADQNMNLRIFKYHPVNFQKNHKTGPFSLVSHLFIAEPLDVYNRILIQTGDESKSRDQARMMQIIGKDTETRHKIVRLEDTEDGRCVFVKGTIMQFEEHYVRGQRVEDDGQTGVGSLVHYDPKRYFLLNDIFSVSCR